MCLGIPGRIVEITDVETNLALADASGVKRKVNVTCVAGEGLASLVDKWVLIHVGFAMAIIDEKEAEKTDGRQEIDAQLIRQAGGRTVLNRLSRLSRRV